MLWMIYWNVFGRFSYPSVLYVITFILFMLRDFSFLSVIKGSSSLLQWNKIKNINADGAFSFHSIIRSPGYYKSTLHMTGVNEISKVQFIATVAKLDKRSRKVRGYVIMVVIQCLEAHYAFHGRISNLICVHQQNWVVIWIISVELWWMNERACNEYESVIMMRQTTTVVCWCGGKEMNPSLRSSVKWKLKCFCSEK
jgi:hypothetical protein